MPIPLNLVQHLGHIPFFHHITKSTLTLCFIPGFRSSFQASNKSTYLYEWSVKNNIDYLTWDHPKETSIQEWCREGFEIIKTQLLLEKKDEETQTIIFVGASLGIWLGLHISDQLLRVYKKKVNISGLIGIGGAVDMTEKWLKEVKEKDIQDGLWKRPSNYAKEGYYAIPLSFLKKSQAACILPTSSYKQHHHHQHSLQITYPIHLIHGKMDTDVSMNQVYELMDWLNKKNIGRTYLHLMEDGDHRMSREQDLWLLDKVLHSHVPS